MLSAAAVIEGATATTKVVRIKPPRVSPVNRTEVEEAIERAYEIVVVSDLSDPERAAAIESGANCCPRSRGAVPVPGAGPARHHDRIRPLLVGEHEAEVGFTLLLPGPRPVPGMQVPSKGYAVEQDGTWKVARATYSELIGRLGIRVPPPTET